VRDKLGKLGGPKCAPEEYVEVVNELKERMDRDAANATESTRTIRPTEDGKFFIPHWLAQPYFRPLPPTRPTQ